MRLFCSLAQTDTCAASVLVLSQTVSVLGSVSAKIRRAFAGWIALSWIPTLFKPGSRFSTGT